ncbi:hypothetical protein Gogos_020062 [Gossypium gossypioides]|uniref:DUF7745 domain-containing protein n=1 Tax=Gossypium gossypioides TaxID=34282 RepID=A0A7J9D1A3_GOSGO|nr:hypothetical protein [Gossypium gossypioides]
MVKFTTLSGSEKLVLREVFTSVQDSGLLSEYIRTYVRIEESAGSGTFALEAKPHVALVHIRLVDRKLNMEKRFLDKVEDNAAVQTWSEITQQKKGDSLAEGYELKEIWDQWNDEVKQLFYSGYGDLSYLLDIKVDKHLFRALAQFWNAAYSCFTFEGVNLVPTVEEYMALLRCSKI